MIYLYKTTTQAVSDGNSVLKPVAVGKYVIYFKGGLKNINAKLVQKKSAAIMLPGPYDWDYPVTYHLTIANNSGYGY